MPQAPYEEETVMMTKTQNRRRHERKSLIYYLPATDLETGAMLGRLVDITVGGMLLVSSEKIAPGKIYCLKMELPREVSGKKALEIRARSLWGSRDVNPAYFVTGFQFQDMTKEKEMTVELLIASYGFK
jgi:hypothetical protein